MRVLRAAAAALVAVLLGLLVVRLVDGSGSVAAAVRAGKRPPAPAFDLQVIWRGSRSAAPVGARLSSRELRGRPAVVNFWASWCDPCRAEAPLLARAAHANPRVRFVGVDVQDFARDARSFLRRHALPYPSVHAGGTGLVEAYGLVGLPQTFYLDARGRIVARTVGRLTEKSLAAGIAAAAAG